MPMSTELETLIVERAEGVVTVTMNRPARKNAANGVMWKRAPCHLRRCGHRPR